MGNLLQSDGAAVDVVEPGCGIGIRAEPHLWCLLFSVFTIAHLGFLLHFALFMDCPDSSATETETIYATVLFCITALV